MKNGNWNKRILALLLILAMAMTIFSGCNDRQEPEDNPDEEISLPAEEEEEEEKSVPISTIITSRVDAVKDMKEDNEDTVGWLNIPGMEVDDVVLFNSESNKFYERLNFDKEYDFNGVFYADRRSTFGEGAVEDLSSNLCIYGHALTDDPTSSNYSIKFGPLHDLRDPELAKDIPYILFSTEQVDLAYEIVAIFMANGDNTAVPYNDSGLSQEEVYDMVINEILPRSIYNYDVEIQPNDKFITLSTCIYFLEDMTPTNYPNTYMRYAVMGRLVDPEGDMKKQAEFTINEYAIVDPDGPLSEPRPAESFEQTKLERTRIATMQTDDVSELDSADPDDSEGDLEGEAA